MKISDAVQLFLAVLILQSWFTEGVSAATDESELTISIHLLEDELAASSTDQQLFSVECGIHEQTTFHSRMRKFEGKRNTDEIQEGQYYLQLNGSQIDSYSADVINYTSSVHENGNLTATFYVSKLEQFFGKFTCGYQNFSNFVNITHDLAFAYIPAYHNNHTFLVLFITFFSMFLLVLVVCIIIGVSHLRYRFGQRYKSHDFITEKALRLPHSPLLSRNTGFAIPSRKSSWSAMHSTPHASDFISDESIHKLITYLNHPSPCGNVKCPCLFYKQKVKGTLFWSTEMQKSPNATSCVTCVTPAKEVEVTQGNCRSSPYHDTGCSYESDITSLSFNESIERDCAPGRRPTEPCILNCTQYSPTTSVFPSKGCDITYPQVLDSETSKLSSQFELDLKFIDPVETVTFDRKGGRYVNENHEVCLKVPEGAVPMGKTITIEVGVSLHSQLVPLLPLGKRPVSPLVKFCVVGEENFRFLKPVEVILPHFLDIPDEEAVKGMEVQFMKSGHNLYCFHQCDGTASFRPGSSIATLKIEHFCVFCITAKDGIAERNINYRLVKVIPRNRLVNTWTASFCVAYYLRTCLQSLKKQFPDCDYEVKTLRRFKFAESAPLEICFERKLAGGWHLSLENGGKITPKDVVYWNVDPEELEMMEEDKVYPPRFEVLVCGTHARETVSALICFRGIAGGGDSTELLLESMTSAGPFHALHPSVSEPAIHFRHTPNSSPLVTPRRKNISSIPKDQRALSDAPSHSDLMNFVAAAVPTRWQMVGIQLGLSVAKIDEIGGYHPHDCKQCFSSVFLEWEKQGTSDSETPYTWGTIIEVLKMPSVEENRLADEIASMFGASHDRISMRSSGSWTSGYNTDHETDV